jgi:hypothetical protein
LGERSQTGRQESEVGKGKGVQSLAENKIRWQWKGKPKVAWKRTDVVGREAEMGVGASHKVLTYVEYRAVSGVF